MSATDRIKKVLGISAALLAAAGTLGAAMTQGSALLAPALTALGLPRPLAAAVAWGLLIGAIAVLLILAWRANLSRSRIVNPDRFELSAKRREQVKGRDQDIRDLHALIDTYPLVFLAGESGSGKSAMVEAGLIPDLITDARMLPVLVRRYGSGWDSGPLKETLLAAWEMLSESERIAVDLPMRPALSSITVDLFTNTLAAIGTKLGRQPLLVFDQFDDYQLAHRQEFTTEGGAWRDAAETETANPFWHAVATAVRHQTAHCLFITRSDAAAGLGSVRFTDKTRTRDLLRLKSEFLWPLLESLAPGNSTLQIVADPEYGWSQLKAVLAAELQAGGPILPQQVRMVALGLRSLRYLTLRDYRRAGGVSGMEARYVARSIVDCARQCRVGSDRVRAILLALVEAGRNDSEAKTIARSVEVLREFVDDPQTLSKALNELARSEIVRRVANAEGNIDEWQLDHDYLAIAVLHEERQQNRPSILLRDTAAAWQASAGDWRMRWRTLLPVSSQLQLAWARLRPQSTFRYGNEAAFARISLLRAAHLLITIPLAVACVWWYRIAQRAESLIDSMAAGSNKNTLVELWLSSRTIRDEVASQLIAQPMKLTSIAPEWMSAATGLNRARANSLTNYLLTESERTDMHRVLLSAVIHLGPSLDRPTAIRIAKSVTTRLTKDVEIDVQLGAALAQLAIILGPDAVREAGTSAVDRFAHVVPTDLQSSEQGMEWIAIEGECEFLNSLFPLLDDQGEARLAQLLTDRLLRGDAILYQTSCAHLYSALGARARDRNESIDTFTATFIEFLKRIPAEQRLDEAHYVGPAYAAVRAYSKLDPETADLAVSGVFEGWKRRFESECFKHEIECGELSGAFALGSLARRIADFGASLSPSSAQQYSEYLIEVFRDTLSRDCESADRDSSPLIGALRELASALDDSGAQTILKALRQDVEGDAALSLSDGRSVFGRMEKSIGAYEMLGELAAHLNQEAAGEMLTELLVELRSHGGWARGTLTKLAPRLNGGAAKRLADVLLQDFLQTGEQSHLLGLVAFALPESQLVLIAQHTLDLLFNKSSRIRLADTSWLLGKTCEALTQFEERRAHAIHCMMLAASFPMIRSESPSGYDWDDLRRFAKLPLNSDFDAVREWVHTHSGVRSDDIAPTTVRQQLGLL
jgi:hypothetical protein